MSDTLYILPFMCVGVYSLLIVIVEFTFCVYRNAYRLVKTEICTNSLLSSLLDRQE